MDNSVLLIVFAFVGLLVLVGLWVMIFRVMSEQESAFMAALYAFLLVGLVVTIVASMVLSALKFGVFS